MELHSSRRVAVAGPCPAIYTAPDLAHTKATVACKVYSVFTRGKLSDRLDTVDRWKCDGRWC